MNGTIGRIAAGKSPVTEETTLGITPIKIAAGIPRSEAETKSVAFTKVPVTAWMFIAGAKIATESSAMNCAIETDRFLESEKRFSRLDIFTEDPCSFFISSIFFDL